MRTLLALTFILLALEASARDNSSDPENEIDMKFVEYLKLAIDNFRKEMKQGISEMNITVLDPLELKNLKPNVTQNIAKIFLEIETMTVNGLSEFEDSYIRPDLENSYLELVLKLPAVTSFGTYTLSGRLLKIFPLSGSGKFQINITDGEIGGTGRLYVFGDKLQLVSHLYLKWEKMTVRFENFLGGGKFSETLQSFIPFVGKSVFEKFKPDVLDKMEKILNKNVNAQLEKPDVLDFVKDVLSQKESFY